MITLESDTSQCSNRSVLGSHDLIGQLKSKLILEWTQGTRDLLFGNRMILEDHPIE